MLDVFQDSGFLKDFMFQVGYVLTRMAKKVRMNGQSGLELKRGVSNHFGDEWSEWNQDLEDSR